MSSGKKKKKTHTVHILNQTDRLSTKLKKIQLGAFCNTQMNVLNAHVMH